MDSVARVQTYHSSQFSYIDTSSGNSFKLHQLHNDRSMSQKETQTHLTVSDIKDVQTKRDLKKVFDEKQMPLSEKAHEYLITVKHFKGLDEFV